LYIGSINTWSTNAIEGNTLSLDEVELLIAEDRTPSKRPFKDVLETVQHKEAFDSLLERVEKPITAISALELHEAVFRGVLRDAGQWRTGAVRILGSPHRPPRAERIGSMMLDWERVYAERDLADEDVFRLAAWLHHEFESIHPFSDGNGRVGRLLLNLHLLKHSWPTIHVLPVDRDRYIDTMIAGHKGDLRPLEELIRELMGRSLIDLLDQVGTAEDSLMTTIELGADGPYSGKYLSLRAKQGELPGLLRKHNWWTSHRAISIYRESLRKS
jgi:Fic family protein